MTMPGPTDNASLGLASNIVPHFSLEPSTDFSPLELSPGTTQRFKQMLASTRNAPPDPVTANVFPVPTNAANESFSLYPTSVEAKRRTSLEASTGKVPPPPTNSLLGASEEPSHSESTPVTESVAILSRTRQVSPARASENLPPLPRSSAETPEPGVREPSREHRNRKEKADHQPEAIVTGSLRLPPVVVEDPAAASSTSPPIYSPPEPRSSDEQGLHERTDVPRSKGLYAWLICTVAVGSLLLPAGLILLSLLTQVLPSNLQTHMLTTTSAGKLDGTNSSCLVNDNLYSDVNKLYAGNVFEQWVLSNYYRSKTICCLYNNSRYHKPGGWDYLPKHVPFSLCPCLVYWSMGIRDGRLVSRVPEFDKHFGLKQLDQLKGTGKVLVTVGGYGSDSVHFSRLGTKRWLMTRFVADVLDELLDSRLDGVNIHWTYPNDSCGHPSDWSTLLTIIEELRALFHLNAKDFAITVMMTWDDVLRNRADIVSKVNHAFIDTHTREFEAHPWSACATNTASVKSSLMNIPRKCNVSTGGDCACFSSSIMPWAMRFIVRSQVIFSAEKVWTSLNISQQPGRAALYEICKIHLSVLPLPSVTECIVYVNNTTATSDGFMVYIVPTYEAIVTLLNHFRCILIYDIDFDIYKYGCGMFAVSAGLATILNAQPFSPG